MIRESFCWKKELYSNFLTIANSRYTQNTELLNVEIEKALLLGAYIIRKLNEAEKLPPDLLLKKDYFECFLNKNIVVDHMNWHKFNEHYDFSKAEKVEKEWRFMINQIIHSFSLVFSYGEDNKLNGFLLNSDVTKKSKLFFLPVEIILKMFLAVSEGDITSASSYREEVGKNQDGSIKLGEMKLKSAVYSYPDGFDIDEVVMSVLNGGVYVRDKT